MSIVKGQMIELDNTLNALSTCQWDDVKPATEEGPECGWCKKKNNFGLMVYRGGIGDVWMCADCDNVFSTIDRKEKLEE